MIEIKAEIKKKLKGLKTLPGIYQFLDKKGDVLYVGKAKNLRDRVQSYFKGLELRPQIIAMLPDVCDLKTIETDSEVEAIILESKLIAELNPPANLALKDDKSFLSVGVTNEELPRVVLFRQRDLEEGTYSPSDFRSIFGPFPSASQLKRALRVIRKALPYRDCSPLKFQTYHRGGRPCIFGFINVCPRPCLAESEEIKEKYLRNVLHLEKFLAGKKNEIMKELEEEMVKAANSLDFERAAELRDSLNALKHIQEVSLFDEDKVAQSGQVRVEAYDISNISGTSAVGSMVVLLNNKKAPSEYRKFRIRSKSAPDDLLMMREVLVRRFNHPEWPQPDLIIIDGGQNHLNLAKGVIDEFGLSTPILAVAKGKERKNAEMFFSNRTNVLPILGENPEAIVRRARDEAHRFAIGYHRDIRSKKTFKSIFDDIPGIGKITKIKLLQKLGSAKKVRNASREELAEAVGEHRAEMILKYFNKDTWQ